MPDADGIASACSTNTRPHRLDETAEVVEQVVDVRVSPTERDRLFTAYRCRVLISEPKYDGQMASPRELFVGRWRITSMEAWDELDLLGPAFIEFDRRNGGMFQFVAVSGDIDYRVSTEHAETVVEWSWLGDDDGENTGGRGWAVRDGDNLMGHFYIHRGDDSSFVAAQGARRVNARRA